MAKTEDPAMAEYRKQKNKELVTAFGLALVLFGVFYGVSKVVK